MSIRIYLLLMMLLNYGNSVIDKCSQTDSYALTLFGKVLSLEQKLDKIEASGHDDFVIDLGKTITDHETEISQQRFSNELLQQNTMDLNITMQHQRVKITQLEHSNELLQQNTMELNKTAQEQQMKITQLNKLLHQIGMELNTTVQDKQIETTQLNHSNEILQQMIEELNQTNQLLNASFKELKVEFEELQTKQLSQNVNQSNLIKDMAFLFDEVRLMNWTASAPAFHVQLGETLTVPVDDTIVVFHSIKMNANDFYNVTDGIFRAPVRGRYLFSLSVRHDTGKNAFAKIMHNDTLIGWAISKKELSESPGAMPSSSAVVDLNVNDIVYVMARDKGDRFHSTTTSFMGCLLYPL